MRLTFIPGPRFILALFILALCLVLAGIALLYAFPAARRTVSELPGGGSCGPDLSRWNAAGTSYEQAPGVLVRTTAELQRALSNPQSGGMVSLANGTWEDVVIALVYSDSERPFIIRAQTPGQVRLLRPEIKIGGRAIVLDGFVIEAGGNPPVQFAASGVPCTHCRLTNSVTMDATPPSDRGRPFVRMRGSYNRVDHNYFIGGIMSFPAVYAPSQGSEQQYHRIDHNYFGERYPQYQAWDGEAIMIGEGPHQNAQGEWVHVKQNVLIDENYICAMSAELIDGGEEVISLKSSDNYVYHNTFDTNDVRHGIVSRFGDRNVIDSNYIFGGNRPGSTGITLAGGRDHVVRNNYIQDVAFAGLSFYAGTSTPNPATGSPSFYPLENATVEYNTLVNCAHCLLFGYNVGRSYNGIAMSIPPSGIDFANNIVFSPTETLVDERIAPAGLGIQNSFFSARALGFSQIGQENTPGLWRTPAPELVDFPFRDMAVLMLPSGSDAAAERGIVDHGSPHALSYDIDKQCRISIPDIGAHEYGADPAPSIITINDVGPSTYDASRIIYANRDRPDCLFNRGRSFR